MINVKSEINDLLAVDYLTSMAADQVITQKEPEQAKWLAEIEYGIKTGVDI